MKRIALFVVATAFVLAAALPAGWIVPAAKASDGGFSPADVDGPYGFSLDGSVTSDGVLYRPANAAGQFDADEGSVTELNRTLNVGGLAIVRDRFQGQVLEVLDDGRGIAAFCSIDREVVAGNPAVFPYTVTYEVFSFVITGDDNDEIEFVGIKLEATTAENAQCDFFDGIQVEPPGQKFVIPSLVRGIARKQGEGGDSDD